MTRWHRSATAFLSVTALALVCSVPVQAQSTDPYIPKVGQSGKDTPWVPTPAEMVERMLDLAKVTPKDLVVDLGSGDGRNVIAAAKRGARAHGVEYNAALVELSKKNAQREGVGDKATFAQGDMFEADFSQATVLALFLLPDNLRKLEHKILALKPGSRVVANTFGFTGWEPESTIRMEEGCRSWCEAMLYIVPARVDGSWQMPQGALELHQEYVTVKGTLTSNGQAVPVDGVVHVDEITFSAGGVTYMGRVKGDRIEGKLTSGERERAFTARRSTERR